MNTLMDSLKRGFNYTETENGALARKTTMRDLYDMFALGGAFRGRKEEDCILLFKNAFEEDEELAMKCLFYLRDIRGGQGERRFFRVCMHWLAKHNEDAAARNIENIAEYGRWDDLYCLVNTPLEDKMFSFIKNQLEIDLETALSKENAGVSLLAKWLKSENCSSTESKELGNRTRKALKYSHKHYRKTLSLLRNRINIVEKLMSENRWSEIEFDKIPSKAGLMYRNTFAHKEIISEKYADFMSSKTTKVNAAALYPYDIVKQARNSASEITETQRETLEKYWNNQKDYFNGSPKNILCVVDTSGSMTMTNNSIQPIDVAISLGMYCAERNNGDFKNHYISFASRPQLIKIEGSDFVDKVSRIYRTNLIDNTNLEAVFALLYNKVVSGEVLASDLPETLVIISDMEIDEGSCWRRKDIVETEMEAIEKRWERSGIKMPNLVYWNVDARQNLFLSNSNRVSYVSGCSPSIFKGVLEGKIGFELCLDTLNSERYSKVK